MALTKISQTDFFSLLNTRGRDGSSIIKDVEVDGFIQLNSSNFHGHFVYIFGCSFPDGINFSSLHNAEGIKIENCQIGFLSFDHVVAKYTQGTILGEGTITLTKVTIHNSLKFDTCEIHRGISLMENCEVAHFQILNTTINDGDLFICDSTIKYNFILNDNSICGDVRLIHSKFRGIFNTSNIKTSSYRFEDTYVKRDLEITNNEISDGFYFLRGDFESSCTIRGSKTTSNLVAKKTILCFKDSKFHGTFAVKYEAIGLTSGIQTISLLSGAFEDGLLFYGEKNGAAMSKIETLDIFCSKNLSGTIAFNSFDIEEASVTGTNFEASLFFENITFHSLQFKNFTNHSSLQLIDVRSSANKPSELRIKNTHFGKSQLLSTNLRTFTLVYIENVNLTQISSSLVTWFTIEQLDPHITGSQDFYKKRRELFRQLKFAMEHQGDRIQALVFKQYEMISYRHELNAFPVQKWWERFIMFVNRSNDYGQNWWRPVLLIFSFTAVFYYLITITQSPDISSIEISKFGFANLYSSLCKNFGVFFQMLYPAHLMDIVAEGNKNIYLTTYFLDFFYRIILSYLIFQTISAFRKYVK